jgi:hypothetical protein
LDEKKDENPIYITGSFVLDLEKVYSIQYSYSNTFDTTRHIYYTNYQYNNRSTYYRILLGPAIGFGIYFDFGRVNFQTEFSFSAKFAPFVNRGFKEYSFDLSLAPVLKFVK